MFIHPDQKAPVARLLQFLRDGEYLASDCARAQSKLAPNPLMRRFLLSQSRQESYHAFVFQGAIAWLAPRHLGTGPLLPPMERYRTLIEEAIGRGDFAVTLMAEQIILEGLDQAILKRIEESLAKRNAPFERMRRLRKTRRPGPLMSGGMCRSGCSPPYNGKKTFSRLRHPLPSRLGHHNALCMGEIMRAMSGFHLYVPLTKRGSPSHGLSCLHR